MDGRGRILASPLVCAAGSHAQIIGSVHAGNSMSRLQERVINNVLCRCFVPVRVGSVALHCGQQDKTSLFSDTVRNAWLKHIVFSPCPASLGVDLVKDCIQMKL